MKRWPTILALLVSVSAQASLTIGAYNIRNFDYDERAKMPTNKSELSNTLRSLRADVLSIEEVNNTQEFGRMIAARMPGYEYELTRCGGEHGQHLGFVYNKSTVELISFNEDTTIADPAKPSACDTGSRPLAIGLFRVKATGQKFMGITVHLKSGNNANALKKRSWQYQVIKKAIANLKSKSGVTDFYIAGDFNTTEYINRGSDYKQLTSAVRDMGMIDLAQNLACSAYWWGGTDDQIETPSVLDHIIVTPGLLKIKSAQARSFAHCQKVSCREVPIKDLGISYEQVSDHCPISATIQ
jgi:endonuclease/exonuclease/phosphatase family metal-dependent hydrolase